MFVLIYMIGYIYMLISSNGLKYIGSSSKSPTIRLSFHKSSYKRYKNNNLGNYVSSFKLFENNASVSMVVLKEDNFLNKIEMRKLEGQFIMMIDCVNKNKASRTLKQYYIDNKQNFKTYYQNNKVRILAYQKTYIQKKKAEKNENKNIAQ